MTHSIRVLSETPDTVTIGRGDFEALLQAAEDAEDLAALAEHDAAEGRVGPALARADYLTGEEAARLMDGESPVKVWREKRGLTQRALAGAAGMQPGYLADIERGQKPGSVDALNRLSAFLRVGIEDLMKVDQRRRQQDYGPVNVVTNGPAGSATGGNPRPPPDPVEFATNADALAFVRDHWAVLSGTFVCIADEKTRAPIFHYKDVQEMFFDPYGRPRTPLTDEDAGGSTPT